MSEDHITACCKNLPMEAECEFRKGLALWRSQRNITPLKLTVAANNSQPGQSGINPTVNRCQTAIVSFTQIKLQT